MHTYRYSHDWNLHHLLMFVTFVCTAGPGQRHHLHLWKPGRGVPQASHGAGPQTDLSGHLQLHQVPHQTGV